MDANIELPSHAKIEDLLNERKRAVQAQHLAETALRNLMSEYQESETVVSITGYPTNVTLPQHDDEGMVVRRVTIPCAPLIQREDEEKKPRTIAKGKIVGVSKSMVGIAPVGADNSWNFYFGSIIEMNQVVQ